jgi:tetratricopeptide (TPR) repeat protein
VAKAPAKSRKSSPKRKVAPKSARPRKPAAKPQDAKDKEVFGVEIEPGSIEKTLVRVRKELTHWVNKGRYTKVRFKLRGKPILPDLPVGAVIAVEAATFWWAGLLRALLFTLGANVVLEVELINDADKEVARGKESLLGGDLDRAIEGFTKALEMDRDNAPAHLSMGIALKLQGNTAKARKFLEKTEQLDPDGTSGAEARRLLDQMNGTVAAPTPEP